MTTERHLAEWRDAGIITAEQAAMLGAIVRKDRFSVFLELNAALYLGVLAIAAGLGWTVHDHFENAGDFLIIVSLSAIFGACLFYCFTRDARAFAFDYVLYLGCLTFAVLVGYVEFRFQLLEANWDGWLLASAILYFALAYRFDNRFVLSLALSTLAGWFGVRFSTWRVIDVSVRNLMLMYGALVGMAGVALHRARIRPHFLDAYLHVAANAILAALVSGTILWNADPIWITGLVVAVAATVALGAYFQRFAFVVYGCVYGYVGLSAQIARRMTNDTALFAYFIVSGIAVIAGLAMLARRRGRE